MLAFLVFSLMMLLFAAFLLLFPILYSVRAVGTLFLYPRQLKNVFGNKILRRNHALEHATIAVMVEKDPRRRFSGFSDDVGFFVQGVRTSAEVEHAAREALRRLHAGEKRLAIHRNCGTTIVAANLLAAVFFLVALGVGLYLQWNLYALIVGAVVLSLLLRVPFSLLLQRFVTTDSDLTNAEVGWAEPAQARDMRQGSGFIGALIAASSARVRVFHTDPNAVEILRDDGAVVK